MQSMMERAVEKEAHRPPSSGVDVAGWALWGSLEKVGRPIQSGTSSEPLLDLPPFPRKSLLVLIRRPLPPNTTSSSSSSPASSSLPSSTSYSQPVLSLDPTAAILSSELRGLTLSASSVCCARCIVQC